VFFSPNNGIVSDNGAEGTIGIYNHLGLPVKIIHLDIERPPVTRADRRRMTRTEETRIEGTDNAQFREAIQARLDNFEIPEVRDCWRKLHVDEFGYCWAMMTTDEFEEPDWSTPCRIFSPDGEYLGDTEIPQPPGDTGKVFISRGRIVHSYYDRDTDETVVELYRVSSAVPGMRYPD
jgi:hypothetical protein